MYSVEWNDYTFRVGDHAYVILDEEKLEMVGLKKLRGLCALSSRLCWHWQVGKKSVMNFHTLLQMLDFLRWAITLDCPLLYLPVIMMLN